MSLLSSPLAAAGLAGTIYDFEEVGDVLPMHEHDEATAHVTVVARGAVRAHGNGWDREFEAGAVIDFPPRQRHEFVALEPRTRIVNITKAAARDASAPSK